jgi:hypothetical protein
VSRIQKDGNASTPVGIQESVGESGRLDYFLTRYIPFCQDCHKPMEIERTVPNLKLKDVVTRFFTCECGAKTHDNVRRQD